MPTQYYNLPTISQDAVANVPDDMNGLATAVDFALHQVAGNVPDVGTLTVQINTAQQTATNALSLATENQQDIASSEAEIVEAKSNIQTLQGNVATVSNTASNAQVTANNAQQGVNTLSTALQEFEKMFNLNTFDSVQSVSGLGTGKLNCVKNSSSSLFKFYGTINSQGSSTSAPRSAIPGGSGEFAYGVPTGLYVDAPDEAYMVNNVGIGYTFQTMWNNPAGFYDVDMAVGTNGQIYLFPYHSSANWSVGNPIAYRFYNCLYFNKSFGDTPIIQG